MCLVVRFEVSEVRSSSPSAPLGPSSTSPVLLQFINTADVTHSEQIESRRLSNFQSLLHPRRIPVSPPRRDEFLLRPAVHVITVVTARWSVIHFSDLCIPITKWRLLSGLCVCPVRAAFGMLRCDEVSEAARVSSLPELAALPPPSPRCSCVS